MATRSLIKCDSGSVAVEIALIIPIIIFLLYGTIDLYRLHQLSSRAGLAAELIADHFSQVEILSDQLMDAAFGVTNKIASEPFFGGETSLTITAIRAHSENGQKVLWTRQKPVGKEPCLSEIYHPATLKTGVDMPVVVQFFYQVDLCVEIDSNWIFSGLSKLLHKTQRTAIALARTPAVRRFD